MMAPRNDCIVEHWIRAILLQGPHRPATLFWQGGIWEPKDGRYEEGRVGMPHGNLKQSCKARWIPQVYSGTGAHVGHFAAILHSCRDLLETPTPATSLE